MTLSKPLIKVCGLTRPQDASLAAVLGADLCGFIFHPKSPRYISPAQARLMTTPGAKRVGVFVDQSAEETRQIMEEAGLDLAQLHGHQGPEMADFLGPEKVIKVFWPDKQPRDELSKLLELWKDLCAYFLFDAGFFEGGHGRRIESELPVSPKRYLLAGGLNPKTVKTFWPSADPMLAGFDLNSGLEESPGCKEAESLEVLLPWR
ncbi:MAG: phosphoribosylanthranilate isomerase [Deltaproteobacteria bacterium]|nr:phosphoribosylanthranilate isomerase [Deltaproteobacteria bacterium]